MEQQQTAVADLLGLLLYQQGCLPGNAALLYALSDCCLVTATDRSCRRLSAPLSAGTTAAGSQRSNHQPSR
jgi:hypothetical protein